MDELGWVHRVDLSSSDIHTGPISVISADSTVTSTETGLCLENLQLRCMLKMWSKLCAWLHFFCGCN